MDKVADMLSTWPDQGYAQRQETIVAVRRFVLAAMESGNPSAARSILKELQAVDLQAWYSMRAEVVSAYGQDV